MVLSACRASAIIRHGGFEALGKKHLTKSTAPATTGTNKYHEYLYAPQAFIAGMYQIRS